MISIIEANSKVYKLKTYNKIANNPIYRKYQKNAINKKSFNLKLYNIQKFKKFLSN